MNEAKKHTRALRIIHNFFDAYSLPNALKEMESIIKFANKNKVWHRKRSAPSELLYFMDHMHALVKVAYLFAKLPAVKAGLGTPVKSPQCITLKDALIILPRHLSMQQYYHPNKVFKKFIRNRSLKTWRRILTDLTGHALSNHSAADEYETSDMLLIRHRLLQLIEVTSLMCMHHHVNPKS